MQTFILYHDSCWDGVGAAWATWRMLGDHADYLPVQHGQPLPDVDWRESFVYILDFVYPTDMLEAIAAQARSVLVIDHHSAAQVALATVAAHNCIVHYKPQQSAAGLTGRALHRGTPAPRLVQYIEDCDLERWQLPDSRAYNAALRTYPFDFTVWYDLAARPVDDLIREGYAVLRGQP